MSMPLVLTVIAGLLLTVGDIILKKWVTASYTLYYIIGIVLYFISMNLLAQSFKYESIAIASLLMIIFNIFTLVLVEYFVFKETITLYQCFGLILGLVAVLLLEFGKR